MGSRGLDGSIGAVVVNKKHVEWARIVLIHQRRDRLADNGLFVSGGHNRCHGFVRGGRRRVGGCTEAPESAPEEKQIDPGQERGGAGCVGDPHRTIDSAGRLSRVNRRKPVALPGASKSKRRFIECRAGRGKNRAGLRGKSLSNSSSETWSWGNSRWVTASWCRAFSVCTCIRT